MRVGRAIDAVVAAEADLAGYLSTLGDRHPTEPDVYHVAALMARQCDRHVEALAPVRGRVGDEEAAADDGTDDAAHGSTRAMLSGDRHETAGLAGPSDLPDLQLIEDLRRCYVVAQACEIDWIVLAQAAAALRDAELVELAGDARDETERCGKWLRTRLKSTAAQALGRT